MANQVEQELCEMYKKIFDENKDICDRCRGGNIYLSKPLSAWLVGDDFCNPPGQKPRILFVGKNAIGNGLGEDYGNFWQVFEGTREHLWNKRSAFWRYTCGIVLKIFGDDSAEHIAMTNFIKCNEAEKSKKYADTSSPSMKENCIGGLKMLRKEIEIIRPNILIFYTGKYYDDYIKNNGVIFDEFTVNINEKKKIGKKNMDWLAGEGWIRGQRIDVLRVWHPQTMKRCDYISAICKWIRSCNQSKSIY